MKKHRKETGSQQRHALSELRVSKSRPIVDYRLSHPERSSLAVCSPVCTPNFYPSLDKSIRLIRTFCFLLVCPVQPMSKEERRQRRRASNRRAAERYREKQKASADGVRTVRIHSHSTPPTQALYFSITPGVHSVQSVGEMMTNNLISDLQIVYL